MKKIYSTFIFITLSLMTFAQKQGEELNTYISTANEKMLVKENTDQMMSGYYNNADKIANKLLEINKASANYNYRKGHTSLMLSKNPNEVIYFLSKATNNIKKNYDVYSTKNVAPIDVYYYLGISYQNLEKLDSAEYFFNLFNAEKYTKKSVLSRYAYARIKQINNARQKIAHPNNDIEVINLGPVINTQYPEYASVTTIDGKTIYYTARKPWGGDTSIAYVSPEEGLYPEDIYMSRKENNTWSKPVRLKSNTPQYNEAFITISANQQMIYTYSDSVGRGDIYATDIKNIEAPYAQNVIDIEGVNSKKSWETSIFFTADGNRMFFSSDRKGGFGGRDIYYCDKNSDGTWSEPKNMGPGVNSSFDEESPFISNDGKYFFYSSNNEQSLGGFDIFYASKTANGEFSNGQPLNYPLNSTSDDVYYTSSSNNYKGYLTSSRSGSYGDKDIYEIDLNYIGLDKVRFALIAFKTLDDVPMPETVKTRILCEECSVKSMDVYPDDDGIVISALEPCKTYIMQYLIGSEEKIMKSDTVKTDCELAKQEIKKEYTIDVPNKKIVGEPDEVIDVPVEKEAIAEYKKPFGYNKNTINKTETEYKEMVKNVRTILKDKETHVTFEIYSSASTVPTKTYVSNENLSQLRANNAMKTLMKEFDGDDDAFSRIKIEVKEADVKGPVYENDAKDIGKYAPFQYVVIKAYKK